MARGYYSQMKVTDYGPYIVKLILCLPAELPAGSVDKDTFSVYAERLDECGEVLKLPKSWMARDQREPSCGCLAPRDAYISDREGNKAESGRFAALELPYGPTYQLTAAICAPESLNIYINNRFVVTQVKDIAREKGKLSGMIFDHHMGTDCEDLKGWINASGVYEGHELGYGFFVPETEQKKKPLIIWLHGAGEGGVDPTVAYTGNKVVAMAKPAIQDIFGGAYVLAPQTRTFWMNDGSGTYGMSSKSMYAKALYALIREFVKRHTDIDTARIYIGGDSNGGFMTMRMVLDHPKYFAAAFPTCEAFYDKNITEKMLNGIKDLPIWFVHSKDDPVVDPKATAEPTYLRLKAAGNENAHFTFWDHIEDIHDGFTDENGAPFRYLGHFAWIHVYNDDCRLDYDGDPVVVDGREVSLMQWLSMQKRR